MFTLALFLTLLLAIVLGWIRTAVALVVALLLVAFPGLLLVIVPAIGWGLYNLYRAL